MSTSEIARALDEVEHIRHVLNVPKSPFRYTSHPCNIIEDALMTMLREAERKLLKNGWLPNPPPVQVADEADEVDDE